MYTITKNTQRKTVSWGENPSPGQDEVTGSFDQAVDALMRAVMDGFRPEGYRAEHILRCNPVTNAE